MTTQASEAFTPYSTVVPFQASLPTWMSAEDGERITAYQVYEQMYWSAPETFKLVFRGSEDNPVYLPTPRTVVDTTCRFLCPQPGFIVDADIGEAAEQEQLKIMFSRLMRRERYWSKFTANKKFGAIRGDWLWHIIGNPTKAEGSRLKIESLDPAAYFPVSHPDDPDKIIAVHIVEQFEKDKEIVIKRQTYYKGLDPIENDGSDTTIYNEVALFKLEEWDALDSSPIEILKPFAPLPPAIKTIPVYHIRHRETPGDPFGSSELRGLERVLTAINQGISDEELILALEGLGMYATDGGPPRDEGGRVLDWVLGPGRVVEHPQGTKFERVSGVTSVAPMLEHLNFLIGQMKEASATPDAATGKIDVTVAESGIALLLQLGPLLAKVDEMSETVDDVHRQMFHDISTQWLVAYEGLANPNGCVTLPVWGSAVPENKDKLVEEVLKIVEAKIADTDWARTELTRIRGYAFAENIGDAIVNEQAAFSQATDPFASRMQGELGEEDDVIQEQA